MCPARSAADCISYAFGLHLAGAAVRAVGLFRVGGVDGVKFGVGNFMDSRLDGCSWLMPSWMAMRLSSR